MNGITPICRTGKYIFAAFEQEREAHKYVRIRIQYNVL
jgi:hypothetical protein